MRPRSPFPTGSARDLRALLARTTKVDSARRIQAVLMRALDDSPPQRIAEVVGLSVATVRSLHSRFLREGITCLSDRPGRGGSRRRHLDDAAEAAVLVGFVKRAKAGGVLDVAEIRAAIEAEIGHPVAKSTIYRLMARHGWRKIAPRPRHPGRDPSAADGFKKGSRRSSRPSDHG